MAGGLAHGDARVALWVAAVIVDYGVPLSGYATPGLGRSETRVWAIAGGHLAERCQLLVIIALGESILVTGATYSVLPGSAEVVAGFVVAFLGSVVLGGSTSTAPRRRAGR